MVYYILIFKLNAYKKKVYSKEWVLKNCFILGLCLLLGKENKSARKQSHDIVNKGSLLIYLGKHFRSLNNCLVYSLKFLPRLTIYKYDYEYYYLHVQNT